MTRTSDGRGRERRHRTIIRLSAVLAVVALAKGCGDSDSPSAPPPPEPARPTTVTVSPATHELSVLGATVQLSAEVRDQNDRVMAGATVTWTTSANSVATVDAAGLVTAVGNGTATITASAGSASGSAAVTVAVGVPPAPDLVVGSPSVSNSSPLTGASFTLSATVRNQGDGSSAATTLRYYRSTNATITTGDTQVDTDAVGTLAASGTSAESIGLTAPASAGRYYYGACVDDVTGESDTSNNCSSAVTVTVGVPPPEPARPTTVTVSPATHELSVLGATVQLSAEVRDQNDRVMAGATVTWTTSANSVATVDAAGLVTAVGNGTATITASAGSASGSAAVTVAVGVPPAPDLVVGSPSVSNSSPLTGASFTLSATVRNQGSGPSAATTLRYYRSADATITTGDTQVDTDAVGTLAASGTSAESIGLTAPASAGRYYYGACVDDVTGESDTSNNCSSAVTVTVGVPPPEPARPTTVTVSPATHELTVLGATVQLSAEVRDQNDRVMAGATVTWKSSANSVATVDAAGLVTAVGNGTATITASAGSASGSAAVTVAVGVPPAPDLVVGSPSVSNSSPLTGASFTLSATVRNQGSGPSAATTLRYYRSTDATISSSDTEVGTDAVGVLSASGTSAESIDLTAPGSAGTYYYGACVDAVTGESSTTNNCSSSVQVDVTEPPPPSTPDLTVGSPSVDDSSPETGGSFTLSATVTNSGDAQAAATTLRYYRSTDATISSSDTEVGTDAVGVLSASGTSAESIDLTAPGSAGTYYYGACVDAVTGESSTTNNCSGSVTLAVQGAQPDLTVTLSITPPVGGIFHVGSSFEVGATVSNAGDAASPATTLRYYLSKDAPIRTPDTQVGTDAVAALAAPGASAESLSLTAPSTPGKYYYNACVDAVAGESNTTNNCSFVSIAVTVLPEADLVVGSPSVTDSSPETGGSFTLSATVSNAGDGASAATTLRYYRSTDATITTSDTEVGTDALWTLAASGTSAESISLTAPNSAGTYYYGACVDAVSGESSSTNNCSTSVQVDVETPQPQQTPASVEVTAPQEWAPVGETVTYTARVLDSEGEEIDGAKVSWSSSDTDIATVDENGVVTAVAVGEATVTASTSASVSGSPAASTAPLPRAFSANAANAEMSVSGSLKMDVVKPVASIELDPSSLSFDEVGGTQTLTATLYDADDNEMSPTYWGWSSADREVAAVNGRFFSEGVSATVQAIGEGTTTVTLSANGTKESANVTVTITGRQVDISPGSLTFTALGDTKSVTVRVLGENGDEDTDATFSFSGIFSPCCGPDARNYLGGTSTRKVDGGLEVTARGPGRGQITINSQDAESAILPVTVYMAPASLEISPDLVTLAVDGTTTLRATVKDANGNSTHVDEGDGRGGLHVYWETSDSEVATVETTSGSATATVTGIKAGTVTISGRPGGTTATGTATLTVTGSN